MKKIIAAAMQIIAGGFKYFSADEKKKRLIFKLEAQEKSLSDQKKIIDNQIRRKGNNEKRNSDLSVVIGELTGLRKELRRLYTRG